MAYQFSVAVRNASLDAIETVVGASPVLELRSGAAPANCGTADSGTLLASLALPADWLALANNGQKQLSGTWQDLAADANGLAGHFRVKQGATCHIQGSVSIAGGTGDMTLDNNNLAIGQQVTIVTFNINAGGA